MPFTPLPLSQTVTPSRTPSPSSVTYMYFMDGPNGRLIRLINRPLTKRPLTTFYLPTVL